MSTKNILVAKNYEVVDHSMWYKNRSSERHLSENYAEMQSLMTDSARQFVANLDDVVIHTGTADNIRSVFRIHFHEIYQLWQTGVNILYVDLDVLFVKPFEVFGTLDYFAMFNYTTPRKTVDRHYDVKLDHYFNCGIRYYPATMSQQCWDTGIAMVEQWNWGRWDTEQVIYNHMMWSQGVTFDQVFKPWLAYQFVNHYESYNNNFNSIPLAQACAIHFHGTRGSGNRLEKMRAFRNETCTS